MTTPASPSTSPKRPTHGRSRTGPTTAFASSSSRSSCRPGRSSASATSCSGSSSDAPGARGTARARARAPRRGVSRGAGCSSRASTFATSPASPRSGTRSSRPRPGSLRGARRTPTARRSTTPRRARAGARRVRRARVDRSRPAHPPARYQCTHNPFLEETLNEYYVLTLRIWFLALDRVARLEDAIHEHRELLVAIREGDARRAEEAMRRHVSGFETAIRRVL